MSSEPQPTEKHTQPVAPDELHRRAQRLKALLRLRTALLFGALALLGALWVFWCLYSPPPYRGRDLAKAMAPFAQEAKAPWRQFALPLGSLGALLLLVAGGVQLQIGRVAATVARPGENKWAAERRVTRAMAREEAKAAAREYRDLERKPWWLVELSGAHLLWWIALGAIIGDSCGAWRLSEGHFDYALITAVGMGFFKCALPFGMRYGSRRECSPQMTFEQRRREARLFYRWWSGWILPPLVALAPAAAVAVARALP